MTDKEAKKIVKAILSDISGRRGLGDEWDGIDSGIQREIRAAWVKLIMENAS